MAVAPHEMRTSQAVATYITARGRDITRPGVWYHGTEVAISHQNTDPHLGIPREITFFQTAQGGGNTVKREVGATPPPPSRHFATHITLIQY